MNKLVKFTVAFVAGFVLVAFASNAFAKIPFSKFKVLIEIEIIKVEKKIIIILKNIKLIKSFVLITKIDKSINPNKINHTV